MPASGLQLHFKRDPGTDVFLSIFQNSKKHSFLRSTFGGCFWNEKSVTLYFTFFRYQRTFKSLELSKGNTLKILALFFDPPGMLQPISISLKALFQNFCRQKFEWDESVSDKL